MGETILVGLIVLVAAVAVAWRLLRMARGKGGSSCGCGCSCVPRQQACAKDGEERVRQKSNSGHLS